MSLSAYHSAIQSLPYGKHLPTAVYLLDSISYLDMGPH
jgi:hypothetical protein